MFFGDSQEPDSELADEVEEEEEVEHEEDEDEEGGTEDSWRPPPGSCSQGHRPSLNLRTRQGGGICLLCLSNLLLAAAPPAPTVHVSYALSQLSRALSDPPFLRSLLASHAHLLPSPLVRALSASDDEPIARQIIDLMIVLLSHSGGELGLAGEFAARVSDLLCSRALGWSRRQVHVLHCFGILLNHGTTDIYVSIKDRHALVVHLMDGLQLPSDDIQGEILFVLYKLSVLQREFGDGDKSDPFVACSPKLIRLSLDVLLKTQSDDVRLNCVALLSMLVQRGFLKDPYDDYMSNLSSVEADSLEQVTDDLSDISPLCTLFSEAIKGPLLSSDGQVQMSTLELIAYYLGELNSVKQFQLLVEANIADYVFEILRLSECKDPVVSSCLRVLDLLSSAGQAFTQRLAVGFASLIPVFAYVAEVPFHPSQLQLLKLIFSCISNCPGVASTSQSEQLAVILARMLRRYNDGETGMLSESFMLVCSILMSMMNSPSSHDVLNLTTCIQESSKDAILACLSATREHTDLLLHSLLLLKEAFAYGYGGYPVDNSNKNGLQHCVIDICRKWLLPWLWKSIKGEEEEETVLCVLDIFHAILIHSYDDQTNEFAENMISSSWFTFSFSCLALYPTERMKSRIYLMMSSLVEVLLGNDCGQNIRDAVSYLPSDPNDLLFLLGQQSSHNLQLSFCQSAALQILYCSSLFDERLAADKVVLASIEQYILVNGCDLTRTSMSSSTVVQLVALYSLYRGLAKMSYQMPYSPEAERLFIQLVTKSEWDLLSTRIHPTSLKWLFQQEKLCESLSCQILKFCRISPTSDNPLIVHGKKGRDLDVQSIAELVAAEDNYAAKLFVYIFEEVVMENNQENDLTSVLNLMADVTRIFPEASNKLCLNGIAKAIHNFYNNSSPSSEVYTAMAIFIFNILSSVDSDALADNETWVAVAMKLMDHLIYSGDIGKCSTCCLILGILCLVLHHSTNGALVEASKIVLLNTSLASTLSSAIHVACPNGPAMHNIDEGTKAGETLIHVLLLHYFAFKSMHAVLPNAVDWDNLIGQTTCMESRPFLSIKCHDLCRLMHFGPPLVKLVASYCLLELFIRLSEQRDGKHEDLCTDKYWMSLMAVFEGLLLYNDTRVAINSSLCLAMILKWEEVAEIFNRRSMWCRLILEELVISLAAPSLASKSPTNHHKAAVIVSVALLKLPKVPEWMRSVFNDTFLTGILGNLTGSDLSAEIFLLLRELLNSQLLCADHVANLNRLLQECRTHIYGENTKDESKEKCPKKVIAVDDDTEATIDFLVDLITSDSQRAEVYGGLQIGNERLLDEIEMYFRSTAADDGTRNS
ncbi:protein PUTATIVE RECOMBINATION INITIATION DEFECT 1 [Syzygium oleosum]|uniref:protein PUTATIVE RECOMBINATION INITIATION DEFECT 1 n=1 Tax=Syzygium oleosum TaxID=219896 RepID=UPI0024B95068|nr:protein PUTATIVE RECOMBINATION INITIATION DEFECT 1 [Syzygium oleosum]